MNRLDEKKLALGFLPETSPGDLREVAEQQRNRAAMLDALADELVRASLTVRQLHALLALHEWAQDNGTPPASEGVMRETFGALLDALADDFDQEALDIERARLDREAVEWRAR